MLGVLCAFAGVEPAGAAVAPPQEPFPARNFRAVAALALAISCVTTDSRVC